MTREKFIDMAKKFNSEKYDECCETIDNFEEVYDDYEGGFYNCWIYDSYEIEGYKREGLLPEDFPSDDDTEYTDAQTDQLNIAIVNHFIDKALDEGGTLSLVLCYLLHEYFEEYLDKV